MNGQKVVKVFCHEEAAIKEFNELNDELFHSADEANAYSLVATCRSTASWATCHYVLCAIIGGALVISGFGGSLYAGRSGQFPGADPPASTSPSAKSPCS